MFSISLSCDFKVRVNDPTGSDVVRPESHSKWLQIVLVYKQGHSRCAQIQISGGMCIVKKCINGLHGEHPATIERGNSLDMLAGKGARGEIHQSSDESSNNERH